MEKGDKPAEDFSFYPLLWITAGYFIDGCDEELIKRLENSKENYMEERGYVLGDNTGYDAGLHRTSRVMAAFQKFGMYTCVGWLLVD
jgi:hypothetical protein